MRQKNEKRYLECILTDKEKLDYSKEIGKKLNDKNFAEDSLKSVQTEMKAKIQSLSSEINKIATALNSGREYRDVECEVIYDFRKGVKSFVRKDTGEIAAVEEISEREKQEEIL